MNAKGDNENGDLKDNQENIFPIFVNEQTARVPSNGSAPYTGLKEPPNRESKLPEIIDKIKDPKVSVAEITRLIAIEMALISQDMQTCERDVDGTVKLKNYMGQLRALREVASAAKEADAWAVKADVLDFDGPKFGFVLGKLTEYFKEAALAALRNDQSTVKSIMMHLRDIVARHEPELRRETAKIGYHTDTSSARLPSQEPNEPRESSNGKIQQCPEPSPTIQSENNQTIENGAPDNTTLQHRVDAPCDPLPSQELNEPPESSKAKIQQSPEVSPTDQLGKKQTTGNGTPKNATMQHRKRRIHWEPEENEVILPFQGLADPESRGKDLAMAKEIYDSIERHAESDDGMPPPDGETESDDNTPSSASGEDGDEET